MCETQFQYSVILNSCVSAQESSKPALLTFSSPQMVMHSILASRIFFNLRETSRREQSKSVDTPLTEFHATHQDSSGFSSSLGVSTSSSGAGAAKAIDTTGVIEITRECAVQV